MIFDHIVNFPSEDDARAEPAMARYWSESEEDGFSWRGDIVISGMSVYKVTGTETITPPPGEGDPFESEIREPFPGWFAAIALPELSADLRDMPNNACMLIADRDAADRGETDFIVYLAASFNQADLPITNASPVFAGAAYPFHSATVRAG